MTTPPGQPRGEWRAGPAGGAVWVPSEQPSGPDGGPGLWAWVPAEPGPGEWRWFPAAPAAPAPAREARSIRRSWPLFAGAGAALGLALLGMSLAGRDGAPAAPAATTGSAPVAAVSDEQRSERLVEAVNRHARAVLAGDAKRLQELMDPLLCSGSEQAAAAGQARRLAERAEGATAKVRSVAVHGDRGIGLDWEFTSGAPAEVRALAPAPSVPETHWPWRWRDDGWRYAGGCLDDGTEPGG